MQAVHYLPTAGLDDRPTASHTSLVIARGDAVCPAKLRQQGRFGDLT